MATRHHSRRPLRRNRAVRAAEELHTTMASLGDAIAVLRVAQRSLNARETAGEEEAAMRMGLVALSRVHEELDGLQRDLTSGDA